MPKLRWTTSVWVAGALAISMKWVAPLVIAVLPSLAFLNQPGFNALGFISELPVTEDYPPVLPWLGVMLWGLAAGQWALARRRALLAGGLPRALRPLAVLGRWSLLFYMLHQPVLIGAIMAATMLR